MFFWTLWSGDRCILHLDRGSLTLSRNLFSYVLRRAKGQNALGTDAAKESNTLSELSLQFFRIISFQLKLDRFPNIHSAIDKLGKHGSEMSRSYETTLSDCRI